jgi:SNF2 family DNA or RNA helicase
MILEIENNDLLIYDNDSKLNVVAKSQLSFWHFDYNYINRTYRAKLDRHLFVKLVRYLDKESVEFKFGKTAKAYSQEISVVNLNFENLKATVANYKDGDYDRTSFNEFKEFVDKNIKRTLKIHQLKAAYHLYLAGNGANFSVPGSGKTTVVLTVYEKLKAEGKVNTLFVVGPPSSFGPWRNEFTETLGRIPKYSIMAGGNRSQRKSAYYNSEQHRSELYLTSFQTLLSDKKEVTEFLKQKNLKALFVVDEAHYIKQLQGNWARAILQQAELAQFRCVLTGTPMPKSYSDIFNLFDFLWPNQHPISSIDKAKLKLFEERRDTDSAKEILDESIGPLFYRVRKIDLRLTPQNFIAPYVLEMGPYEKKIYQAIFNKIRDYSQQDYFKNIKFIDSIGRGRIMRLRQAVSYPRLLNTAIDDYDEKLFEDLKDLKNLIRRYDSLEVPSKIKQLLRIVKQLRANNQKVVIWTNFIGTIKLIKNHLKLAGFNSKEIYGGTPVEGSSVKVEETREKIRDQFVALESGLDILIANPAACAESISLHKTCHHAIYYDLSYNCAQFLQSLDRIHRVGGSELVEANYHFLQYENSIDIDIKRNVDDKTRKMLEVIEEDYAIYSLNMSEPDGDEEAYLRIFHTNRPK